VLALYRQVGVLGRANLPYGTRLTAFLDFIEEYQSGAPNFRSDDIHAPATASIGQADYEL
jgi:hypothetical protein